MAVEQKKNIRREKFQVYVFVVIYIFHYKYPTMYYRQHNGVLQYQYSRNVSQNIDWRRESEQSSMERGLRRSFHRVKNDKKKIYIYKNLVGEKSPQGSCQIQLYERLLAPSTVCVFYIYFFSFYFLQKKNFYILYVYLIHSIFYIKYYDQSTGDSTSIYIFLFSHFMIRFSF